MSEAQAQRMSFLFCCGSGRASKVCCCTLRTGSYILSVIIILLYVASLVSQNKNSTNETLSIIMVVIKIIIQILFIVSVSTKNFQLSFIVWIIDSIFTYLTLIGLVVVTILFIHAGGQAGADSLGVVITAVILLLLIMVVVLYLNYVIYSVSKIIGLNKTEELDGIMTSHTLNVSSDRMI